MLWNSQTKQGRVSEWERDDRNVSQIMGWWANLCFQIAWWYSEAGQNEYLTAPFEHSSSFSCDSMSAESTDEISSEFSGQFATLYTVRISLSHRRSVQVVNRAEWVYWSIHGSWSVWRVYMKAGRIRAGNWWRTICSIMKDRVLASEVVEWKSRREPGRNYKPINWELVNRDKDNSPITSSSYLAEKYPMHDDAIIFRT